MKDLIRRYNEYLGGGMIVEKVQGYYYELWIGDELIAEGDYAYILGEIKSINRECGLQVI